MKFNAMLWNIFTGRMKKGLVKYWPKEDIQNLLAKAKPIYRDLLSKVEGISDANPMASNITMSFIIVAIWLASDKKIKPAEMSDVMNIALDFWLMKAFYGTTNMNTDKGVRQFAKMIHKKDDWAKQHPEDTNNWDFNFDESKHRDGFYYHFTQCPINNFCRKYGLEEITPVLCNIDYTTMSMMHSKLIREQTLASGGCMCDYWLVGNQNSNPQ